MRSTGRSAPIRRPRWRARPKGRALTWRAPGVLDAGRDEPAESLSRGGSRGIVAELRLTVRGAGLSAMIWTDHRTNPPEENPVRTEPRAKQVPVLLVLVLGIALRATQFFAGVDLWHDELAVARNVEARDLAGLVAEPLDHQQVAPVGFLVLVELSTHLLGVTTPGLRLAPFLASLVSLVLFWRVAARFASGFPLLASLALFCASPALVWYGSSVKPYGTDVALSLLLVWLGLRFLERPDSLRRGAVAGAAGGLALLFSFPAVPTAAVLGLVLAVAWWRREPRPPAAPIGALAGGWVVGAAVATWLAMRLLDSGTATFMEEFWSEDFPPAGDLPGGLAWAAEKVFAVFGHSLLFLPPRGPVLATIVALPLGLAAIGLLLGRRAPVASRFLLLGPIVAALGAAFGGLLPFDQRLGLHSAWPWLVLAASGLDALGERASGRWSLLPRGLAVVMALPLVSIVLLGARPPYEPTEGMPPRDVLEGLATRVRPGDAVYVYTQGRHDMAFYGSRAGLERWTQGERHYENPRGYLREIDRFRGTPRLWFFWVRLDGDEPAMIRRYLGAIGRESERIPGNGDESATTGAILYDLSDAERSRAISAENFPIDRRPKGER